MDAEIRVKEADQELERLEREKKESGNLDAEDQEPLQGGTQTGIQTIR